MVLGNWREALKVFLVPVIFGVAVIRAVGVVSSSIFDNTVAQLFTLLSVAILLVFVLLWTVVSWHRFVLLEENPTSWVPPLRSELMLSYFSRSLILIVLCLAVATPFYFSIGTLTLSHSLEAFSIFKIVMTFGVSVLMYRLGVGLPAVAIGERLGIVEAFSATKGATSAIVILLFVLFSVGFAVDQVVVVASRVSMVIGSLVSLLCSSVLFVLNISALTTLYGHYIEGRSVD
ncbi:MAG: hypothetical protein ACU0A6_05235 [Shimia sp.]|uniref:hypothetical protein n=1 Tax=Shimia sp. TaxID=1954381 RepID=UPI004058402D